MSRPVVCAWCKRIRGCDGRWRAAADAYAAAGGLEPSHGICERCYAAVAGEWGQACVGLEPAIPAARRRRSGAEYVLS